jgi:DNA-binding XRE family transcriptional regulator
MSHMHIGQALKAFRSKMDIGTRELAKQIGISSATLNRIENENPCDMRSMVKLIAWLFS